MKDTRSRILEVAEELFSKRGYHTTSVEDIVKQAGLSKGAFYFHFRSKEDLFQQLLEKINEELLGNLQHWVDKKVPVEEALLGHAEDLLRMFYKHRRIAYIFMFQLLGSSEEFRKIYFEKMAKVRQLLTKLIERGVKEENFTYRNVENIVNLYMGYMRIVMLEYMFKEEVDLEEVIRLAKEGITVLLKGLRG
ncbi:transcriptional regulator, TetR family [Thermocrinis albus DSM 14484]|uniref:Transcriptional regulator, TetR family n=1 Tax=Thermocrinis albus (strain DSM 14484 / JCM 11386 / HI 11/12) TaxID=638303 RepID=D3SNK3_THEAH|nr:TetR/AcrR family transcriptional regulator [Thermocrinis albus]ADC88740.1 transcriptional regulator, TetR family [Thermocrinis albus DSM 14484]